jgi:hypothetical protein
MYFRNTAGFQGDADRAFAALRSDPDFLTILAFIEHSVSELDRSNRAQNDDVTLRQQQGAAQALAEFVERARGVNRARATDLRKIG